MSKKRRNGTNPGKIEVERLSIGRTGEQLFIEITTKVRLCQKLHSHGALEALWEERAVLEGTKNFGQRIGNYLHIIRLARLTQQVCCRETRRLGYGLWVLLVPTN